MRLLLHPRTNLQTHYIIQEDLLKINKNILNYYSYLQVFL